MYVGRKHTATVTAKEILPFDCKSCRFHGRALVVGVGQGAGNSPYFLDEQGAKGRAMSSAETSAHENCALTISLARCPRCKKVDAAAHSSIKGKYVAIVVATLVGFPIFGLVLDGLQNTSFGIWIFAPIGLFTAFFIWARSAWKWKTVDQRVVFVKEAEANDVEVVPRA